MSKEFLETEPWKLPEEIKQQARRPAVLKSACGILRELTGKIIYDAATLPKDTVSVETHGRFASSDALYIRACSYKGDKWLDIYRFAGVNLQRRAKELHDKGFPIFGIGCGSTAMEVLSGARKPDEWEFLHNGERAPYGRAIGVRFLPDGRHVGLYKFQDKYCSEHDLDPDILYVAPDDGIAFWSGNVSNYLGDSVPVRADLGNCRKVGTPRSARRANTCLFAADDLRNGRTSYCSISYPLKLHTDTLAEVEKVFPGLTKVPDVHNTTHLRVAMARAGSRKNPKREQTTVEICDTIAPILPDILRKARERASGDHRERPTGWLARREDWIIAVHLHYPAYTVCGDPEDLVRDLNKSYHIWYDCYACNVRTGKRYHVTSQRKMQLWDCDYQTWGMPLCLVGQSAEEVFEGTVMPKAMEKGFDIFKGDRSKVIPGILAVLGDTPASRIFEQLVNCGLFNLAYDVMYGLIGPSSGTRTQYGRTSFPDDKMLLAYPAKKCPTSLCKALGMDMSKLRALDEMMQPPGTQSEFIPGTFLPQAPRMEELRRILNVPWSSVGPEAFGKVCTLTAGMMMAMAENEWRVSSGYPGILGAIYRHQEMLGRYSATELINKLAELCGEYREGNKHVFVRYVSDLQDYWNLRMELEEQSPGPLDEHAFPAWPRLVDITIKHNRLIPLVNNARHMYQSNRLKILNEKYQKHVLPKLKKFEYKNDVFMISYPSILEELDTEGTILHHCVGSYKESVANGREYILFLRKTGKEDTPWYTIDVTPTGEVRQIHTSCNGNVGSDPECEAITAFLKEWADTVGIKGETLKETYGLLCHV